MLGTPYRYPFLSFTDAGCSQPITTTVDPSCVAQPPSSHNQAARGNHLARCKDPRANHDVSLMVGMPWPYLAAINSPPRLGPLSPVAKLLAMQVPKVPR
ncbi:predicted protein [Plenodomus lingam JN3]|uniref:Predicted protein n=1 Tax=Leptosphaeria maculans (strain JN3 / isolate v23.1.3 / race Av1-4-5-6-7-8) TaxID=985895 RepID=E4ZVN6_LEPMJ|nr:predicted protein [Plenodomus lingam JN3]CBX95662.1 predicted protein [Plenodomus lingam JN3]